jgi:hypothetical protein
MTAATKRDLAVGIRRPDVVRHAIDSVIARWPEQAERQPATLVLLG